MNRPSVRYRADPRFLGDDVRLRFGGSYDAALVYDPANDKLTVQTTDAAGALVDRLAIGAGSDVPAVVVNDAGAGADFRIEGDTEPNLLFIDAGSDRVGIGTGAPGALLDVNGDVAVGDDLLLSSAGAVINWSTDGPAMTGGTGYVNLSAHKWFINDTANTKMTVGLTINQGAYDNEILTFKSSDVAHTRTSIAEADTYALFQKADGAAGGLSIYSFRDAGGGAYQAFNVVALMMQDFNTTKSAAGRAPIEFRAAQVSGDAETACVADGNIFMISAYDNGGAWNTKWILDEDGDTWQSGGATIGGNLDHDGSNVGFYNTTPAAKQTVTGSRGGNAALASLLTALAAIGLVTDSSSA